jgi:hemolysin III
MRGWLHAITTPLLLTGGIILIVLAPTIVGKISIAIYLASAMLLFAHSAVYHLGHWSAKVGAVLRRIDHSNINLFIAGTYTPLAALLLTGTSRIVLLSIIWGAALLGVVFRVCWLGAPRWLYVGLYILLGWAAVGWLPQFAHSGGPAVVILIVAGGIIYSLGAVVYALKKPDPSPRWFGFHEIFHSCTVIAAFCHFAAIAIAVARS